MKGELLIIWIKYICYKKEIWERFGGKGNINIVVNIILRKFKSTMYTYKYKNVEMFETKDDKK